MLNMIVLGIAVLLLIALLAIVGYFGRSLLPVMNALREGCPSGKNRAIGAAPAPFGNHSSTTAAPVLGHADVFRIVDSIENLMAQTNLTAPSEGHLDPDQCGAVVKLLGTIEKNVSAASNEQRLALHQALGKLEQLFSHFLRQQSEVEALRKSLQGANDKVRSLEAANARLTEIRAATERSVPPQPRHTAAPESRTLSEKDLAALRSVLAASMGGNTLQANREFDALRQAFVHRPASLLIKALFENDRTGLRWLARRAESAGGDWALQWADVDASRRQLADVIGRYGFELIWPEAGDAFDDAKHRIVVDESPHHHARGHVRLLVRPGVECPNEGYVWPAIVDT